MYRGLSQEFLNEMRRKLECGRNKGYVGWDRKWEGCAFSYNPTKFLFDRLRDETNELLIAIVNDIPEKIFEEAADVANFAMFIADLCGEKKFSNNAP